jgi:subtilisin family serine protease
MSYVARRFRRRLSIIAAGVAAAAGLGVPAAAQASTAQIAAPRAATAQAQAATTGYSPSSSEWWLSEWDVPTEVWPLTEGAGVTVGVVDSGVQASVADLRGVVLRGGDVLGAPGNGDIDYATFEDGHGTTVAALIAGQGVGPGDVVGIAPRAKILPVHILSNGATTPGSIAAGIKYAVNHGAKVVNLSVGGPPPSAAVQCDPEEQAAVAYAVSHNVVVVSVSGDTNTMPGPEDPGTCAGVLTVGGIEPNGRLWQYSTQDSSVSVAAPADHITAVGADGRTSTDASGTSFASPLVAGEAALIRSRYPSMPWYQVDQRIIGTAIRINGLKMPNDGYGYGIANVAKAVDASKFPVASSSPNPPYTRYLAWLKTSDGQAWAKENGVTVPSSGSSRAAAGSGAAPTATAAAPTGTASSGSSTVIIVLVVVIVVVVAAIVIALVARSRKRSRPGAYPPGTPGTYPSGGQYPPGPPGGQYPPPPGPYPPGPGSYPPPSSGSYPPGGDQQQR